MPRLRQVPRSDDNPRIVTVMYDMLFGPDRDPVAQPGTDTGRACLRGSGAAMPAR